MRKFIVLGLAAVCAVVMAGDTALAVVGGGGNSGGGKTSKKHHIKMENKDHEYTIACWVRPKNTPYPHTLGELKKQIMWVEPYGSGKTKDMKKGYYEVTTVCAHDLNGDDHTPISEGAISQYVIAHQQYYLKGKDLHLCCDKERIWKDDGRSGSGGHGGGYGSAP